MGDLQYHLTKEVTRLKDLIKKAKLRESQALELEELLNKLEDDDTAIFDIDISRYEAPFQHMFGPSFEHSLTVMKYIQDGVNMFGGDFFNVSGLQQGYDCIYETLEDYVDNLKDTLYASKDKTKEEEDKYRFLRSLQIKLQSSTKNEGYIAPSEVQAFFDMIPLSTSVKSSILEEAKWHNEQLSTPVRRRRSTTKSKLETLLEMPSESEIEVLDVAPKKLDDYEDLVQAIKKGSWAKLPKDRILKVTSIANTILAPEVDDETLIHSLMEDREEYITYKDRLLSFLYRKIKGDLAGMRSSKEAEVAEELSKLAITENVLYEFNEEELKSWNPENGLNLIFAKDNDGTPYFLSDMESIPEEGKYVVLAFLNNLHNNHFSSIHHSQVELDDNTCVYQFKDFVSGVQLYYRPLENGVYYVAGVQCHTLEEKDLERQNMNQRMHEVFKDFEDVTGALAQEKKLRLANDWLVEESLIGNTVVPVKDKEVLKK